MAVSPTASRRPPSPPTHTPPIVQPPCGPCPTHSTGNPRVVCRGVGGGKASSAQSSLPAAPHCGSGATPRADCSTATGRWSMRWTEWRPTRGRESRLDGMGRTTTHSLNSQGPRPAAPAAMNVCSMHSPAVACKLWLPAAAPASLGIAPARHLMLAISSCGGPLLSHGSASAAAPPRMQRTGRAGVRAPKGDLLAFGSLPMSMVASVWSPAAGQQGAGLHCAAQLAVTSLCLMHHHCVPPRSGEGEAPLCCIVIPSVYSAEQFCETDPPPQEEHCDDNSQRRSQFAE